MKKSFTLCLLLGSLFCLGQNNSYFSNFETIPCPFDSAVTISTYKDWLLYQTLDGHWNGPVDSTICISLRTNPSQGIDLNTVDIARPIFLRSKFTEANKELLEPNFIYSAYVSLKHSGASDAMLKTGTDCPNNLCSGLIAGIQIPDETGTSTKMRWYTDVPSSITYYGDFETCLPTEYFDENYLREFIIKLTLDPATTSDKLLRMNYAMTAAYWPPFYVDEVVAHPSTFVDTSYNVPLYMVGYYNGPFWAAPNYLLLYTDLNSYPSSASPAYVEARPMVNTPNPQTINLIVSDWETFIPQPFAMLRGGLVEGSDSIRHHVNLVNHDGDICMPGPIDFVFDDQTKYIHAGGHVNMEGLNSCMMFRNGGTFELAEGTTMQFGQDGRGIFALRSGGKMVLDKGSTLLFDGTLWLQGIPTAKHPDPQFYLDLKPGTSLVFGEKAGVLNANSISPDIKLNVYMNGGTLDDSQLSAKERLLIHRIYPEPSKRFVENVKVLGNPTTFQFQLDYLSVGNEKVQVEVHDLQGRLVWSKNYGTIEGHNFLDGEFGAGTAGVYVATLSSKSGQASVKVIKID